MERESVVPVADGFDVHARIVDNGADSPIVVFVHGFSSRPWENVERRAVSDEDFDDGFAQVSCALATLGYSTVRFLLYEENRPGARPWRKATFRTYASDIDHLVRHAKTQMPGRSIVVVGHSYGASGILLSDATQFNTAVLLDPAVLDDERRSEASWRWDDDIELYQHVNDLDRLSGAERLAVEREVDLATALAGFDRPFAMVLAGESGYRDIRTAGYDDAKVRRRLVVVDGALHHFPYHRHVIAREIADWMWSNRICVEIPAPIAERDEVLP